MPKQEYWQECTDKWRQEVTGWHFRGGDSFYCYIKPRKAITPTRVDLMCDTITADGLVSCNLEKLSVETDGYNATLRFVLLPEVLSSERLCNTGRDLGGLTERRCAIKFKTCFGFTENDTHNHIAKRAEEEAKKLFDEAVKKYELFPFEDVKQLIQSIIAEVIFYSNAPVGE